MNVSNNMKSEKKLLQSVENGQMIVHKLEFRLEINYKLIQNNMQTFWRKTNPKKFYKCFKRNSLQNDRRSDMDGFSDFCTDISDAHIDVHNYIQEYDFSNTAFVKLDSAISKEEIDFAIKTLGSNKHLVPMV